MNDHRDLTLIIRSRFPVVVVETHEESRFLDLIERVAKLEREPLYVWNAADCLRRWDDQRTAGEAVSRRPVQGSDFVLGPIPGTREFSAMLQHLQAMPGGGIYVLLDAHPFLDDPVNVRLIKNTALAYEHMGKTLVFVSHRLRLPEDLQRLAATFNLVLPDVPALRRLIEDEARAGEPEVLDLMALRLAGMCLEDARRVVRHCLSDDGALTMQDMGKVLKARRKLLAAGAALEVELETSRLDDLAGFAGLKRWLAPRVAVLKANSAPGLEPPRGILLVSPRGAGRRAAARAVAGTCGLPLLRLDASALHEGQPDQPEVGLVEALGLVERMAPCVLWLDALDSQAAGEGAHVGVSRSGMAALLGWMSGRRPGVFVVVTAEDPAAIGQELLQQGRIDEAFFIDLPDDTTRSGIFRMHMQRRGLDPAAFDMGRLVAAAAGLAGGDIEQTIVAALYEARATGEPVGMDILLAELERLRPASAVLAEDARRLRAWAAGWAMPAH